MIKQRTLKNVIRATGVGLHTGEKIFMTLRPAAVNTGIIFRRVDLDPVIELEANATMVGDTSMSSTLVDGDVRVATVDNQGLQQHRCVAQHRSEAGVARPTVQEQRLSSRRLRKDLPRPPRTFRRIRVGCLVHAHETEAAADDQTGSTIEGVLIRSTRER